MQYRSLSTPQNLPKRTLDYLTHGASEGHRNAELFDAACQFRDAGISASDSENRLIARALSDGLGEFEARTTIRSAFAHAPREAAAPATNIASSVTAPRRAAKPESPRATGAKFSSEPLPLPLELEGGFVRLLDACFKPGEFVAIAPAGEDAEGNVMPKRGVTLEVEEWKRRVIAKGGIDRCFSTALGLFIRLNPMQKDGARNEDVTAFRHALVEFDRNEAGETIPKEVQFGAIVSSGLPVSVVIDSGNKSIHAWVRVDAPDAAEYRRRVDIVWDWLEGLSLDKQNKNPSRLSRCPEGWRTVDGEKRRQRLLATSLGAKSWTEWEASHIQEDFGQPLSISQLSIYDTSNDPNNVIGNRWLCRGASLVIVGQSGTGKSSLCMQLIICWALGLPAFGMRPVKPLRSLLIQAENDEGDLAEMYQGVKQGMGISAEQERVLNDRIIIYRDTTHTGAGFVNVARALVDKHRPDLAWADPLLNYIGDDISEQRVIADFCCNQLNAVALQTGVIWCLLHHTGKPSRDPKGAAHWTASDLAYSGLGSSALVNWSRETAVLMRVKTPEGSAPTFQLSMTKRRKRAGLRDLEGFPTDTVFLRHSDGGGICWAQCEAPVEPQKTAKYTCGKGSGRPSKFDVAAFNAAIAEAGGALNRENEAAIAEKFQVSVRTVWNWFKKMGAR